MGTTLAVTLADETAKNVGAGGGGAIALIIIILLLMAGGSPKK
jgi:hypothetical protein